MKFIIFILVGTFCYGQNVSNQTKFLEAIYFDSNTNLKKDYSISEFKTLYDLNFKVDSINLFDRRITLLSVINNFDEKEDNHSIISKSNEAFPWHPLLKEMTLIIDDKGGRSFRIYGFNGNDLLDFCYFMKRVSWERDIDYSLSNLINSLTSENRDIKCVYTSIKKKRLNKKCLISYSDPMVSYRKYD